MLYPRIMGQRCDRLITYIEHKLDLTRQMKSRRKTRMRGITELSKYSNGLELQFLTCTVTLGILVDMSGDTLRRFRAKGWTDRQVIERAGLGQ